MLKETITYVDYDGNERTEDFYFNLTQAELMEMELGIDGGLTKLIEKIIKESDSKRIIETFKKIILKSYGEKTIDGRFIKNDEVINKFVSKQAYSDLFMKLATDADAGAKFIEQITPKSSGLEDHKQKESVPKLELTKE
ncbi:MAG: hypothetical protein IJJ10_03285 [Bacillus sp. (in: Bacteria)]|nr:hypothetical protein [Bacillus sp. (in: firmicutes)]